MKTLRAVLLGFVTLLHGCDLCHAAGDMAIKRGLLQSDLDAASNNIVRLTHVVFTDNTTQATAATSTDLSGITNLVTAASNAAVVASETFATTADSALSVTLRLALAQTNSPTTNLVGKIVPSQIVGTLANDISGNAATATSAASAGSAGSATSATTAAFVTASPLTNAVTNLPSIGTSGTYTKATFDAQGRETSGTTLSAGDIPNLSATYEAHVATLTNGFYLSNKVGTISGPLDLTGNTLSVNLASASANGYLSTADWNTFNGKQAALGFTPEVHVATLTNQYPASNMTAGGTFPAAAIPNTAVSAGSYGSATAASTFTVDAAGRLTAAASTTVTPAIGSVTGLGTGVATALALAVDGAGQPVLSANSSQTNIAVYASTNYGSIGKTNYNWTDGAGWHQTNNSASGKGVDIDVGVVSAQVSVRAGTPFNSSVSSVQMTGNNSGTSGYVEWWKNNSTRLGYMGNDTADVTLNLANSARFVVAGGNVVVNQNSTFTGFATNALGVTSTVSNAAPVTTVTLAGNAGGRTFFTNTFGFSIMLGFQGAVAATVGLGTSAIAESSYVQWPMAVTTAAQVPMRSGAVVSITNTTQPTLTVWTPFP